MAGYRGAIFLIIFAAGGFAKEPPPRVIDWPATGQTVLRFSFAKFKEIGSSRKQHRYTIDVVAENVWGKEIRKADFSLYLFDKDQVRIGDAWIALSDVAARGVVKFQIAADASGIPISTVLSPRSVSQELQAFVPPRKISTTVNSVPQGAALFIDGAEAGVTPKIVQVGVGKHDLEFRKDGYNTGHFPLEITADDAPGGSVSYELGNSAHDTVELRDGSVLSGDVESVTGTEVFVKVGGAVQRLSRNQVKRIGLVTREMLTP